MANPTQKWKPYYETVMEDDILDEIKHREAEEREQEKNPGWLMQTFKTIFPMELNAQKALEQEDETSSILRGAFMFHAAADSYLHQNEENIFTSMLIASVGWMFYIIFLADNVIYGLGAKMAWNFLPMRKKIMVYVVASLTLFECLIFLAPITRFSSFVAILQ